MMPSVTVSDEAIWRILELSADLQIKRRAMTKYSLEFHDCSVAIAAYGQALEALTSENDDGYSGSLRRFGLIEGAREPHAAW